MSSILTIEGRYFHFNDPESHDYNLNEIAHALSHVGRFTGHSRWLYTVAQHAVIVSYVVDQEYALEGLHHDDSEAYLGDVSSPLKALLPDYRAIEFRVEAAIAKKLGLKFPFPGTVKTSDMMVLMNEKIFVMPTPLPTEPAVSWPPYNPHPGVVIRWMPCWAAKLAFLDRHAEITGEGSWLQKIRLKLGLTPLVLLRPKRTRNSQ